MIKYVVTTTFGLEKITKNELIRLGYEIELVENGSITVTGNITAVADLNLNLRTADRVYIQIAKFKATTFDQLFDNIYRAPFEEYLSEEARFPVNCKSVKSTLFSKSDIQKISKKAIVKRLSADYGISQFSEDGELCAISVNIYKDEVSVLLNTSGDALYRRGYRTAPTKAPMKETLAAGLVLLSNWNYKKPLIDPMCGSGTLAIEAAMFELGIAPGLNRKFAAEDFIFVPYDLFENKRKAAYANIKSDRVLNIKAMDIDAKAIVAAKINAKNAGVYDAIDFAVQDVRDLTFDEEIGTIITNPPYGVRLGEQAEVLDLYNKMGKIILANEGWSAYILTANEEFERAFGDRADRNRKLFNGDLKCYLYQYISNWRY